ncbi:MarR family winged helix-turn-helix transcriptional regulator [Rhodalgimonas zhirmunskyi]|uniref:MarR family transcriptional regulator n=1 Tax=Rhodalgimonas zhirmunskyi TaxID=2964767 RepID=A0AAJ1U906_9RHOB|nr:MarR family transcriptional regulator [Rhodoalgimonas zhirmunskyi]MDQ2095000.1 MarR family transcriptional regulator [Rhodoalgimonas zhirmunskyi]
MSPRGPSFHLLLHSADLIEAEVQRKLKPLGLSPRQARVIDGMHRMGPASQARLAREFRVTEASMSTMTARLIKAGYIVRQDDPEDRRGHLLTLTETGRGLLAEIEAAWAEVDRIAEAAIGVEEFEALSKKAKRLRDALGGESPGA